MIIYDMIQDAMSKDKEEREAYYKIGKKSVRVEWRVRSDELFLDRFGDALLEDFSEETQEARKRFIEETFNPKELTHIELEIYRQEEDFGKLLTLEEVTRGFAYMSRIGISQASAYTHHYGYKDTKYGFSASLDIKGGRTIPRWEYELKLKLSGPFVEEVMVPTERGGHTFAMPPATLEEQESLEKESQNYFERLSLITQAKGNKRTLSGFLEERQREVRQKWNRYRLFKSIQEMPKQMIGLLGSSLDPMMADSHIAIGNNVETVTLCRSYYKLTSQRSDLFTTRLLTPADFQRIDDFENLFTGR